MSTFKNIQGKNIRSYANNAPNATAGEMWYNRTEQKLKGVVSTGAWSSSADAIYPSYNTTGFGAQTSSVFVGGSYPGYVNLTQEYNGSGFSTGGNYPESRGGIGTAGVLTAGLAWGGNSSPEFESQLTNEYNGTAWTNVNNYPITVSAPAGAGTQTAGLGAGGWDYSGPFSAKNTTNEYDGTNWTGGGNLNTGRSSFWGGGTQTAAIMAGGDKFTPGTASDYSAETEEYDGTSWTSVNSLPGTTNGQGGRTTNAVQTDFRVFSSSQGTAFTSPYVKNYEYDGTNWAAGSNFTTARYGVAGSGTGPAAIITGGRTPSYVTTTEEFNKSTNIITAAAWGSGGNLNTARQRAASAGASQTSALAFGGFEAPPNGPPLNNSETYNGTAWSEGNNLGTARGNTSGFGTATAAVCGPGRGTPSGPFIQNTEEYDGSSWTAGNASNTSGAAIRSASGTLTAGLICGGFTPPSAAPAEHVNNVEEYDGTNWTNATVMPQYQAYNCQCGTQTATLNGGGNAGPNGPTVNTNAISLDYDGTNWTAGPNANILSDKFTAYNGGTGTQTSALFVGGDGTITARFDGTAFSTDASYPAARGETNSAGSAPSNSALVYAGSPVPSVGNSTLEYSAETTSVNIVDITTS